MKVSINFVIICILISSCTSDSWVEYEFKDAGIYFLLPKNVKTYIDKKDLHLGGYFSKLVTEQVYGASFSISVVYYPELKNEYDPLLSIKKDIANLKMSCIVGDLINKSQKKLSGIDAGVVSCLDESDGAKYDVYQIVYNRKHVVLGIKYDEKSNLQVVEKFLTSFKIR